MKLWAVRELNSYLKDKLEGDIYLSFLLLEGEISNYKRASSGHLYFTLKDKSSAIKAVMFKSFSQTLTFEPKDGMAVKARGYVSLYEKEGIYQLYVQEMEPLGVGDLHIALENLKERLKNEGLFESKHKKRLPSFPLTIGLVTSPVGAVIEDMTNILKRRWAGIKLVLAPVAVQGEIAPREISLAIKKLNQQKNVDLIIVGRGGGSFEDLWAFNSEEVVRAIFDSNIPIISAVGHETDYTLCDMVADLRAATPSEAAELAVLLKEELQEKISFYEESLRNLFQKKLEFLQKDLEIYEDSFSNENFEKFFRNLRLSLEDFSASLDKSFKNNLKYLEDKLGVLVNSLQILSPLGILSRGYALCQRADSDEIIKNSKDIFKGEQVKITLEQGLLRCLVEEVKI